MMIESNQDLIKVSGFLDYYKDGGRSGPPTARVGVLSARLGTLMSAPFDYETAIAIVNPSDRNIAVIVQLITSGAFDQREEYVYQLKLKVHETKAFFLDQLVPPDVPCSGQIGCNDQPQFFFGHFNLWTEGGTEQFAALALIFPDSGIFTSLPLEIR